MNDLDPRALQDMVAMRDGVAPQSDEVLEERFVSGDEAMRWYNGWLKTIPPPPPESAHPEYGWDPVYRWRDAQGTPIYWYVVGTGDTDSLVIEDEPTVTHWGNEYYSYYAALHGRSSAEMIYKAGGLPEMMPPPLPGSTPQAEYIIELRGIEGW